MKKVTQGEKQQDKLISSKRKFSPQKQKVLQNEKIFKLYREENEWNPKDVRKQLLFSNADNQSLYFQQLLILEEIEKFLKKIQKEVCLEIKGDQVIKSNQTPSVIEKIEEMYKKKVEVIDLSTESKKIKDVYFFLKEESDKISRLKREILQKIQSELPLISKESSDFTASEQDSDESFIILFNLLKELKNGLTQQIQVLKQECRKQKKQTSAS